MRRRVVILGAGFAGLELATRLSETIPDQVDVTLIDRNDSFYFGFSKLEVMVGREAAECRATPLRRHRLGRGHVPPGDGDGHRPGGAARDHRRGRPWRRTSWSWPWGRTTTWPPPRASRRAVTEYYTLAGAERLRDALTDFDGGRVLVSVLGQPFKCPPAPFEGSFLLHEYFTGRGIRDAVQMTTTFPMQRPVPVTSEVSQMFRDGLASRGIEELPQHLVTAIDPAAGRASVANGETLDYDLFVGIPVHRAPDPLAAAGLAVDGWVPVDQANLRTRFPQVYALGDVCTGPRTVPKAGIFAESAALVVADDIAAEVTGAPPPAPYQGSGVCYAEFGDGLVSKVEVSFLGGDAPAAERHEPSLEYAADKAEFGATRRARWFGR